MTDREPTPEEVAAILAARREGRAQAAQQIQPGPVPTTVNIHVVEVQRGPSLVVFSFITPLGVQHYFLDAEAASQIGEMCSRAAAQAKSGLVVAPAVTLP